MIAPRTPELFDARGVAEYFDDYLGGVDSTRTRTVATGTATAATASVDGSTGIASLAVATAATAAFIGSQRADLWLITGGNLVSETRFLIPALSDGTDTFTLRSGLIDSTSGESTDGYYVAYTHGTNSGKFYALIRRAGSTVGTLNTNITVAVDTWYRARIRVCKTTGRMQLDINGINCGSVVPSTRLDGTHLMGQGTLITKAGAGSDTRECYVDYGYVGQRARR